MTIHPAATPLPRDDAEALALQALTWSLSDEDRAQRMLALTGMTPDDLRAGLDQPHVLSATLEFLANHEPDLIAAAQALDVAPQTLISAQGTLSR